MRLLEYRSADRQPETHATAFCSHEWLEDEVGFQGIDSLPCIPHFNSDPALVLGRDEMKRRLGRPVVSLMASTAFITRFRITCCNWTRSPLTQRSMARFPTTSMFPSSSRLRTTSRTSRLASLILNTANSGSDFFAMARRPRMMSAVRVLSLTMCSSICCALEISGACRSSQRKAEEADVPDPRQLHLGMPQRFLRLSTLTILLDKIAIQHRVLQRD